MVTLEGFWALRKGRERHKNAMRAMALFIGSKAVALVSGLVYMVNGAFCKRIAARTMDFYQRQ